MIKQSLGIRLVKRPSSPILRSCSGKYVLFLITSTILKFLSSHGLEIISELLDMTYIQPVSFLHKLLGNVDNMKEDMSIVKQDGFYVSFLLAISLEIFISLHYYCSVKKPSIRYCAKHNLKTTHFQKDFSNILNVKYQLLLLVVTPILTLLEYYHIERMVTLDGTINIVIVLRIQSSLGFILLRWYHYY